MKFLFKYHRHVFVLGCFLFLFGATAFVTGCAAPSFLTDIEAALPTISMGLGGILTVIGTVTGNPELAAAAGVISGIVTKVIDEIEAVNEFISTYKTNPSDTLLENIESGLNQVIGDLQPLLAPIGLPANVTKIIVTVTTAFVTEIEAILGTVQVFKSSTAGTVIASFTKVRPAKVFRSAVASALTAGN